MTAKLSNKRKSKALIQKTAFNIKKYRLRAGFTQEKLRELTNISVSRCESGKYDMTLTTIQILSEQLEIEPYELLK